MPIQIPTMPEPSADALRQLEDWIAHRLPLSYFHFVCRHDGARPEANRLIVGDNEISATCFIPVSEAPALAKEIDGFPDCVIPLAHDDCGNYFYVKPETGRVYFWDHEVEASDDQVAEDVEAFIASLEPLDASRVELEPAQVKRVWVNPSFKPEF